MVGLYVRIPITEELEKLMYLNICFSNQIFRDWLTCASADLILDIVLGCTLAQLNRPYVILTLIISFL